MERISWKADRRDLGWKKASTDGDVVSHDVYIFSWKRVDRCVEWTRSTEIADGKECEQYIEERLGAGVGVLVCGRTSSGGDSDGHAESVWTFDYVF